jgi:hypothetical protein
MLLQEFQKRLGLRTLGAKVQVGDEQGAETLRLLLHGWRIARVLR